MTTTPYGNHLIAELAGCDPGLLNDPAAILEILRAAAAAAGTTIVAEMIRRFEPQGVTGVVVIEESHIAVHTWPEHGYASFDFFTCGEGRPDIAAQETARRLKAQVTEVLWVSRGLVGEVSLLRIHGQDRRIVSIPAQ
ncbi:adenosylmethionine decarboxylase [Nocardia sp. NBC_01377]|uniref:adenosylmethionine decarboxylase n=1 Tax=Nocardia sp. NBC_01377 TaxID=2903595 RepID=UPI0038681AD1